ncbi:MAG: Rrf2 family transcriptional regulator [Fibrobacteria bacterium]|nr:Rrf2 family transcriptional regulator [Fibrobacteria bacterium]
MKLTTKFRYGTRALYEIARKYGRKEPVKRKEIVENQQIPESYLENILISLKNNGLISAIRGPNGGFVLLRDPTEITIMDVYLSFEGQLSLVDCLTNEDECGRTGSCVARPVWERLQKAQADVLNNTTMQSLLDSEPTNG